MEDHKKVLVFGTFDGIHDGHRFFLNEAQQLGDTLIICVAQDSSVREHKDKSPHRSHEVRMRELREAFPHTTVVLGDTTSHSWHILDTMQPDIIALGYDQKELLAALEEKYVNDAHKPLIVVLPDHFGDTLHSSLLHPHKE